MVGSSSPLSLYPVYDFLARYVRKLHSDRYIKKTLSANPGTSFLDVIGPSDVAYVITLVKNSIAVWKYDIERPGGPRPKPLYTRGENMKREFGRTAWNDDGMKYYNDTLKVWKKMFSAKNDNAYFSTLQGGWDEWLQDAGSNINPAGWTRKDLSRVLATREEGEMAMDQDSGSEDTDHEDGVEYDSDDDGAPMIGPGGARRGGRDGQVGVGDDDDGEDNMENGGGGDDAAGTMELPGAQAVGATARRGTSMRRVIDDDESEDEEEEAGGEVREAGTKTTGEEDEDYDKDDGDTTSRLNRGGDSAGLGRGGGMRTRLFELPDDIIEDDGAVEDDGDKGGDEPSKMDNRKRKKKKNKDQSSTDKRPTKRARGRGI